MGNLRLKASKEKSLSIKLDLLLAIEKVAAEKGLSESRILEDVLVKGLPLAFNTPRLEVCDSLIERVEEWFKANSHITVIQAAESLGVTEQTARRKLDKMADQGRVIKKKDHGNKYLYFDNRIIDPPGMPSLEEMLAAPSADEEYLKAEEAKAEALSKIKEVKFD